MTIEEKRKLYINYKKDKKNKFKKTLKFCFYLLLVISLYGFAVYNVIFYFLDDPHYLYWIFAALCIIISIPIIKHMNKIKPLVFSELTYDPFIIAEMKGQVKSLKKQGLTINVNQTKKDE